MRNHREVPGGRHQGFGCTLSIGSNEGDGRVVVPHFGHAPDGQCRQSIVPYYTRSDFWMD